MTVKHGVFIAVFVTLLIAALLPVSAMAFLGIASGLAIAFVMMRYASARVRLRVALELLAVVLLGVGGGYYGATPVIAVTQDVNLLQVGSVATDVGNGTAGSGTLRVTMASNSTGQIAALPTAAATGGATPCYITSAASTNATNCKGSAGTLYGYDLINTTTTLYYLRIYNLASAPTCSSATGFVRTIPVPPAAAAGQAGGVAHGITVGEAYGTGVGFCLTGGGSSTDNTNAATGVYVTLLYK